MTDLPESDRIVAFAVHDATGRIVRHGQCAAQDLERVVHDPATEAVMVVESLPGIRGETWVVDGLLRPGLEMTPSLSATEIAADGATECVISGLPDPCTVWVSGVVHLPPTAVTGGSLTLTSSRAGVIRLTLQAHLYRDMEIEIHAT